MLRSLLFLLVGVMFLSSCNKRQYPDFNDLEIEVLMTDKQGQPVDHYNKNEDVNFRYVIRNISDKTIPYLGSACPQYNFKIEQDGKIIGSTLPVGAGCGEETLESELEPGNADHYMISWYANPDNPALSSGEYKVHFNAVVMLQEGKLHRNIDLCLDLDIR